jgi:Co/Zn/Cd efflux system component
MHWLQLLKTKMSELRKLTVLVLSVAGACAAIGRFVEAPELLYLAMFLIACLALGLSEGLLRQKR